MVMYSVFSGLPIILLAWLGVKIQQQCPRIFSFSDFVQRVSLCVLAFKRSEQVLGHTLNEPSKK